MVVAGILFVAAGWLARTAACAGRIGRTVAPPLQRHPVVFYAGLAVLVVLFLVSRSADGIRAALTGLTMAGFAAFGIYALRGQTEREFPEARETLLVTGVADRAGRVVRESGVMGRLSRLHLPGLSDRPGTPGREDRPLAEA